MDDEIYLHDEADVGGEGLNSVEAGDEGDGEETLRVHLPPEEEVSLQVVEAEVVLTGGGPDRHMDVNNNTYKTCRYLRVKFP